jgi:outer membrane lipoprotein-sorting protein
MRPAENIKRLIKNARIKINPEVKKSALKELINELERSKITGLAGPKLNIWRIIMKSRINKIAAAVIIIVIIGLHQFNSSIKGTSIVWADVAERLEKVSSYKAQAHRVLTETGQEEPFFECEILRYFSPDHGSVEESYEDGELVMLAYCSIAEKAALIVFPQNKMYWRFDLNEELLSVVEYTNPANTDGIMKLFGSERCTRLGSREIDGVTTEGFEVKDVKLLSQVPRYLLHPEDINIRLWVNEETLLPTRIEGEGFVGKGLMTGFKEFKYEEVMHSIEYDVEIDESIFDPNIPEDYILIDPANITEKAELVMLCILPFNAAMIAYEHFKKKIQGSIRGLRRVRPGNSR